MRVHELAKKLGVTSKDLIVQIKDLGGTAKNHMSVIDEALIPKLEKKPASAKTKAPKKKETGKKKAPAKAKASPKKKEPEPKKEDKSSDAKPRSQETIAEIIAREEAAKRASAPKKQKQQAQPKQPEEAAPVATEEAKDVIEIRFPITVGNLSEALKMSVPQLIQNLMGMGVFANINQLLNEEIVSELASKLDILIDKVEDEAESVLKEKDIDDESKLKLRPPVVTMMGHVDHGKTSLLDAIRKTNVVAREKGAITQHIGAYGVDIPNKGHVTFIDTPGHEAFTAMRSRGANVTDVVVLVVAADDGVMPQTIEAVDHAREANCPIVVAVNKSDLPSADYNKVMVGLQKMDLAPEEWGGKTVCIKVSAKTGEGIDELLDMLLLESEILELKADPDRPAVGAIVEGHLSKGSGPVATVLVQKGTLRVGDVVVCGPHMGRVRSMRNDLLKSVKEAGPSYAVEISGLSGVPEAGQNFFVVADEKQARTITDKIRLEEREVHLQGAKKHLSLEDLYHRISEGNFKELKIIIKGDVQGSVEALAQSLEKQTTDACQVRVIHQGAGGINESDVVLSAASDAIIIGFHVKADAKAQAIAEKEGVDIRFYGIIYEAVEDVRKAMEGLLEPTYEEVIDGKAEVRQIFKSSKVGAIAGGMVLKGKISRNNQARLIRDNVVLFEGKLASLKRHKDDARDVKQGFECGFVLEKFQDIREGDILESFRLEKIQAKL